ncbi:dynamin family protein [Ruminococcus flavefaciens]|uniref:dynamin family protein n=1 Tax=Ruminococcus flavefaciens TaxID=1265 RepID=UPI0026EE98F8|nr:dynamin family protein [Ruminococcus flavefaciens]
MNEYKQKYVEQKNAILKCLDEAVTFFQEAGYTQDAESICANMRTLESGEFSIAVVGEFSSGKSTFLNALMGEKILPSFTNETTATINFLRHKDQATDAESGIVVYKDGREEKIFQADIETISKYVSTRSTDVDVAGNVDHLDLFLESRFLEDHVTLVDTPGLNGIAEGHREITQQQIKRSSAGIFLFNANQPGSRSDFDFLSEFRKRLDSEGKGNSILYVLNRIDDIKASEGETVESVVAKLKENYRKVYPDATTIPEIWPIAAYPALVARSSQKLDYRGRDGGFTEEEKKRFEELSRMQDFEKRLWKFLTQGEKAKQELMGPLSQLIALLGEHRHDCERQLNLLSGAIDQGEVEEQRLELQKALDSLNDKLKELTETMRKELSDSDKDFYNEIKAEAENFKKRYLQSVDTFESIDEIDAETIKSKIERRLKEIGNSAYENYAINVRGIMSRHAAEITDSLNDSLSEELNLQLDGTLEFKPIKIGLEEFEKEQNRIKADIDKLRKETDDAGDNWLRALEIEQKRKLLEQELKRKQERKDAYEENSLMYVPEVRVRQEEEWVKPHWFNRKRKVIKNVIDDSERKEYLSNRNAIIEKTEKQIEKLEAEITSLQNADASVKQKAFERKNARLSEQRAELERYEKQYAEKIHNSMSAALKAQKKEITSYLDDMTTNFINQIKKEFRNKRDIQISLMEDMVGGSVKNKIQLKQNELEHLEKQLECAISEKEASVVRLNEQKQQIDAILDKALELESDVNSIRVDVIKEENL